MTRYIDADALKKDISEWCYVIGNPHLLGRDEVMIIIDGSITSDVEEVVHCRDCRFFNHEFDGVGLCNYAGIHLDHMEYGFCSYGERRAEAGTSF